MDDGEKYQFGFSGRSGPRPTPEAVRTMPFGSPCTPAKMLSFTPTLGIWEMSIEKQRRECGLAYPNAGKMKGIWRMRPNL